MRLSIGGLKAWVTEQALVQRLREDRTRLSGALYPRQALNHNPDLRNFAGVKDAVRAGGLSADDWSANRFLTGQGCDICARPFEGGLFLGAGALCDGCTQKPFPFRRGRAACLCTDAYKGLLLACKHAERLDLRPILSGVSRAGADGGG